MATAKRNNGAESPPMECPFSSTIPLLSVTGFDESVQGIPSVCPRRIPESNVGQNVETGMLDSSHHGRDNECDLEAGLHVSKMVQRLPRMSSSTEYSSISNERLTSDRKKTRFGVTRELLMELMEEQRRETLQFYGGVQGLGRALCTTLERGLSPEDWDEDEDILSGPKKAQSQPMHGWRSKCWRTKQAPIEMKNKSSIFPLRTILFGSNVLPRARAKSLRVLIWEIGHDRTLILLTIASLVSLGIGIHEDVKHGTNIHWIEGFAILSAVLIVIIVTAFNDFQKERQFRKLNAKKEDRSISVIRDGIQQMIPVQEIVVGDVVCISTGDVLCADGIVIEARRLQCDESSMTGETHAINKSVKDDAFLMSGTKVMDGQGRMLVVCVGPYSLYGKTMMSLHVEPVQTPLQKKLGNLAANIAKVGLTISLLVFIILMIKYVIEHANHGTWGTADQILSSITTMIIQAITILVVAVPEGLPMAVTLALAYATIQMLRDNNLVRVLAACETMGGATTICSDKTGTLTMNQMTVVAGNVCGSSFGIHDGHSWTENLERVDQLDSNTDTGMSYTVESPLFSLEPRTLDSFPSSLPSQPCSLQLPILSRPRVDSFTSIPSFTETVVSLDSLHPLPSHALQLIIESISVNSTAYLGHNDQGIPTWIGNKTEIALLDFIERLADVAQDVGEKPLYQRFRNQVRIVDILPFSSDRKRMSTIVQTETGLRIHSKGASELLLRLCTHYMHSNGQIFPINEKVRDTMDATILGFARECLRTICIAYREVKKEEVEEKSEGIHTIHEAQPMVLDSFVSSNDHMVALTPEHDLVCLAILAIEDPLRPQVTTAVRNCQQAGILVRMVTGDNVITARTIARRCGILQPGGIVLEGREFRKLSPEQMIRILPNLQVLARSSPTDKQLLVMRLKEMHETVAVTGDGTNDAPALKMADVGFSMGIAGTEVAKEASDIVLMDDNFQSLVKAVVWGRHVYMSVCKFLQFQLTVNIAAVFVSFISAIVDESVLTPLQLLWVNLIMDTFAALALSIQDPEENELLSIPPHRKSDPLLTGVMWEMILGIGFYQIVINLGLLYVGPLLFGLDVTSNSYDKTMIRTLVFNSFVFCQLFNEVNCRRVDRDIHVLRNLHREKWFLAILLFTIIIQVILVSFGGLVFQTVQIPWYFWLLSIAVGAVELVLGVFIRLKPQLLCKYREREKQCQLEERNEERRKLTMEKMRWERAISRVQTQLRVIHVWKSE